MKLFLSYSRADENVADDLRRTLESWGHQSWIDRNNVPPGSAWADEIQKGLEWADAVVGVMTREALASDNVKNEWDWSLVYRHHLGKVLYLLRMDDSIVPMQYVRVNWIDFHTAGSERGLQTLRSWLDNPAQNIADLPADPDEFQPYLEALYAEIVQELNLQVLSAERLLEIQGREADNRVQVVRRNEKQRMLRAFSIQGSPTSSTPAADTPLQDLDACFKTFSGRLLLLGAPGSGKTVALLTKARDALLERLQDPAKPLPILGRVATWNSLNNTPLAEWLASYTTLSSEIVATEVEGGRTILLLDGLDELGSVVTEEKPEPAHGPDGDRKITVSYDPRARFIELLPRNNQILLTSRIRDYDEIGFKANLNGAVTLHPLSDAQIQEYLSGVSDVSALWEALLDQPELLAMARRPLLLSLFAFAYRDTPDTARKLAKLNRGELRDAIFSQYIERSYIHETQRYYIVGSNPPYTLDVVKRVLGNVAMRNAGSGRRRFSIWAKSEDRLIVDNLVHWGDFLPALGFVSHGADSGRESVRQFIDFCIRLHVIVRDKTADRCRFMHLLLRDHLVFDYCAPRLGDRDWYHSPTSYGFYGPETNPASALARTDERAIPLLRQLIADTESRDVRDNALLALSEIHTDQAVDVLLEWVSSHLNDWAAAVSLGWTRSPRARDVLVEGIRAGNPWAVDSLLSLDGDARAVEPLIPLLRSRQEYARDEKTRWTAEALLYKSVQPEHVPILIQLLADDHPFVRASAAQALGKLCPPESLAPLQALRNDHANVNADFPLASGPLVSEYVEQALSKFGQQHDG